MWVWLIADRSKPSLRTFKTKSTTSSPTICQCFWKKQACMPSGLDAFCWCMCLKALRTSAKKKAHSWIVCHCWWVSSNKNIIYRSKLHFRLKNLQKIIYYNILNFKFILNLRPVLPFIDYLFIYNLIFHNNLLFTFSLLVKGNQSSNQILTLSTIMSHFSYLCLGSTIYASS